MTTSSEKTALARMIVTTNDNKNIQSLFTPIQLSTSLIEVSSTSSTELQTLPSSTKLNTLVLSTSILDSLGISTNIPSISTVSIFTTSPNMSTIIYVLGTQAISARTIENKSQLSTKF